MTRPRMLSDLARPFSASDRSFCLLQHGQRTNRPLPQTLMRPLHRAARAVYQRHDVLTSLRPTTPQPDHRGAANIAGSHSPAGVHHSHPTCPAEVLLPLHSRRSRPPSRRPFPGFLTMAFALPYSERGAKSKHVRAPGTGGCALLCRHLPPLRTLSRAAGHRDGTLHGSQGHPSVETFTNSCRTEGPLKNSHPTALSPTRAGGPGRENALGCIF